MDFPREIHAIPHSDEKSIMYILVPLGHGHVFYTQPLSDTCQGFSVPSEPNTSYEPSHERGVPEFKCSGFNSHLKMDVTFVFILSTWV